MKIFLNIIGCLLFTFSVSAQETVAETQKLIDGNKETYHVLKSNPKIRQGIYQVRHKNKAVVSGMYNNDKRVGMWHYFDAKGNLLQNYDFDNHQINYEAPDSTSVSKFTYLYDQEIKPTDRVTKPVRIGGRYYGYFPYIKLFKSIESFILIDNLMTVTFELLISPGGNLADNTIYLNYPFSQKTLKPDIGRLDHDDKLFVPATINYEPVSSRISITCRVVAGQFVF